MPFSFPASPSIGDVSQQNGRSYTYAGSNVWELTAPSGSGSTAPGTVTIPASGDPQWGSVACLLSGNGSLTESSIYGRVFTAYGNAAATGAAKVGSASLTFDGDGDYLTVPSSTAYDLGDTYTIEMWLRPSAVPFSGGLIHRGKYFTNGNSWTGLTVSTRGLGSSLRCYFYATSFSDEQYLDIAQSNFPANTWTHFAMTRAGTSGWVYANGVQVGSITGLNTPAASSEPLYVGTWPYNANGNNTFAGYYGGLIDELRITNGICRYPNGTTFTPTESAFPTGFYSAAQTLAISVTGSGGSVSDGNKGDITVSSSAATWTINNPPIHPFLLMGG